MRIDRGATISIGFLHLLVVAPLSLLVVISIFVSFLKAAVFQTYAAVVLPRKDEFFRPRDLKRQQSRGVIKAMAFYLKLHVYRPFLAAIVVA